MHDQMSYNLPNWGTSWGRSDAPRCLRAKATRMNLNKNLNDTVQTDWLDPWPNQSMFANPL